MSGKDWAVVTPDEGVLRYEPTRGKAVAWAMNYYGYDRVLSRHKYRRGDYDYHFGTEDDNTSAHILLAERIERHGYKIEQPLFPYPDRPFEEAGREEDKGSR